MSLLEHQVLLTRRAQYQQHHDSQMIFTAGNGGITSIVENMREHHVCPIVLDSFYFAISSVPYSFFLNYYVNYPSCLSRETVLNSYKCRS